MADTIDDIIAEAEVRPNPAGGNGYLLRSDVIRFKEIDDQEFTQERFRAFLDRIPFLTAQDKDKIAGDYYSYI